MSGFCPAHGPYDDSICPYPPPHDLKEFADDNKVRGILFEDEDLTEMPQARYDDLDVTELESPLAVTLAMLWVKEGPRRGRFYPIRQGTVIGRKVADIILDDPKVSSIHAKFTKEGNKFFVWDFGSSNGTYVNGKRIKEATVIEENDLIKIGDTIFVVKLLESRKGQVVKVTSKPKVISTKRRTTKKARK